MPEPIVAVLIAAVVILAANDAGWRAHKRRFVDKEHLDYYIQFRLMQMLPLPYLGDRESLLKIVDRVAPGRPLAICSVADPPLLVIRRAGHEGPHLAVGASIEAHRAELAAGSVVQDGDCGTLIPARTRAGDLRAALVVGDTQPVTLDAHAESALRYLAALLEYPLALHVWPHALRPERECFRPTPVP